MDRNSTQQNHSHQTSTAPQHSNVPYYDQSMNLINPGMASGHGGYNDGAYQQNRYDRIYTFSLNSTFEPFASNGAVVKYVDQRHSIQFFQLVFNIQTYLTIYEILLCLHTLRIVQLSLEFKVSRFKTIDKPNEEIQFHDKNFRNVAHDHPVMVVYWNQKGWYSPAHNHLYDRVRRFNVSFG